MTYTAAPARPSLAHLPESMRLRIGVAEALGANWSRTSWGWWLGWPESTAVVPRGIFEVPDGHPGVMIHLPDYEHDPAAWGAFMEKERITVIAPDGQFTSWATWADGNGSSEAESVGRAICLAVLRSRGVTEW